MRYNLMMVNNSMGYCQGRTPKRNAQCPMPLEMKDILRKISRMLPESRACGNFGVGRSRTEITYRLQTARSSVRQRLLRYVLPWLCNMELVDPNLPPLANGYPTYYSELGRSAAQAQADHHGSGQNLNAAGTSRKHIAKSNHFAFNSKLLGFSTTLACHGECRIAFRPNK